MTRARTLEINEWRRIFYPNADFALLDELDALMGEWSCAEKSLCFVSDGIFPYYTQQRVKVLFVLRESRRVRADIISECVDHFWDAYACSKRLRTELHYKRMLKILHGIRQGFPHWRSLPRPAQLAESFGRAAGMSCALIHLCKPSLWTSTSDRAALKRSLRIAGEGDFLRREVRLLQPDMILVCGAPACIPLLVDHAPKRPIDMIDGHLGVYPCRLGDRQVCVMSMWHLGAPDRSAESCFYLPLQKALRRYHRYF